MKTKDKASPTVFAIFGGGGDLAWRKLVPALFGLFQDFTMPRQLSIIAITSKIGAYHYEH